MIDRILDFIWPRTCAVCKRPVDRPGRFICSPCVERLPFIAPDGCCRACGRAVESASGVDFLCEDCRQNPPAFDRAGSALHFEAEARRLLLDYKSKDKRRLWLAGDLIDWLTGAARARFDVAAVDVVLPMPSTLYHRLDRGYNPCVPLARGLARQLDRRFDGSVISRIGKPERQAELDEEARRTNVVGTFAVRQPERVRGRTVLVVDDIMTTGSTLSECARALKAAGAWRVWCVTLARSLHN